MTRPAQVDLPYGAKAYVAGPMRGRPSYNFPAFEEAEKRLREWGWDPFSPARRDLDAGFDPTKALDHQPVKFSVQEAMRHDLDYIVQEAQAIIMLRDWTQSYGAVHEARTAWFIGLPVFEFYLSGLSSLKLQVRLHDLEIIEREIVR